MISQIRSLGLWSWFICLMLFGIAATAQAQVVSVFPSSQDVTAEQGTEIMVTFASSMNPASVDDLDVFVFGRWSGVMPGTWQFESNDTVMRFQPDHSFMAGEWVTVSLSKQIEDASGTPLVAGYTWNFWTRASAGIFDFQQIDDISTRSPENRFVRSYGAYAGDFNRDGYSDLMVPNEVAHDIRVFLNDGAGGYGDFTIYPIPNGSIPSTNEGSDFNRDGMIDFAVGNTGNDLISVWMGKADGAFDHADNVQVSDNVRSLCVLDLDGDAVMDIVTANRTGTKNDGNISLLLNNGLGVFGGANNLETNSTGETACATADANNDGILDVFIGAFEDNEVLLYLGDGQGSLTYADKKSTGNDPWMLAAGDVNGDGFADVVSANSNTGNVSVILGNGDGSLRDATNYPVGQFPLAIDLGDLDGDGDLDMVTSNFSSNDYTVLENEGDGSFSKRLTLPATSAASCSILHDRDNDGDLDITGIDELADRIFLFDNVTEATSSEEDVSEIDVYSFSTYPNPFKKEVHIVFHSNGNEKVTIIIHNLLGQQIRNLSFQVNVGKNEYIWDGRSDLSGLATAGLYFVEIIFKHGSTIRGIVKN